MSDPRLVDMEPGGESTQYDLSRALHQLRSDSTDLSTDMNQSESLWSLLQSRLVNWEVSWICGHLQVF